MPPRATPHPTLKKLGKHIRQLRLARNWTQEDLAGECGLDRSYGALNAPDGILTWLVGKGSGSEIRALAVTRD